MSMDPECANCGKTTSSPSYTVGDRTYRTTPPGWLLWQDWSSNELFGERLVCSPKCADDLEVRERAEIEAAQAEYQRRKAAGELSPVEIMMERIAEEYLRASSIMEAQKAVDEIYYRGSHYGHLMGVKVGEVRGLEKMTFSSGVSGATTYEPATAEQRAAWSSSPGRILFGAKQPEADHDEE